MYQALSSETGFVDYSTRWKEGVCPVCGSIDVSDFFEISGVPIQDAVLYPTQEEALLAPVADIKLSYCKGCGYIGNKDFDPAMVKYDQRYDVSLHHSPLYQDFIRTLVSNLVERHKLYRKTILEIACGNGDFLKMVCRIGGNAGVGFDPAFVPNKTNNESESEITFIQQCYSERYSAFQGNFICCRHLLDDLPDPTGFLSMVRQAIGDRLDTIVYFEVPNGEYVFRNLVIWNLIYENCSYFTSTSLAVLFARSGFEVRHVAPCFEDDQYLAIEAVPSRALGPLMVYGSADLSRILKDLSAFASNYKERVALWKRRLESIEHSGQRVVAWGAGARAISFLNVFKITQQIPYVVDINPNRQGKYIPRTGQKVISPATLSDHKPDIVVITNPTFEDEIKKQARDLELSCEFMVL